MGAGELDALLELFARVPISAPSLPRFRSRVLPPLGFLPGSRQAHLAGPLPAEAPSPLLVGSALATPK
eukprot:10831651-Alexandrium_andersonii.AAC.1